MKRKAVSGLILTLLLIIMLTLGFNIQRTEAKRTYNVTAHTRPVLGETSSENNQKTKFITVAVSSGVQVGVKTGDWIKYDCTVSGAPSGTSLPTWMKVEFLSVEGTNVTVRVTEHMSDGTEQNETMAVDVVAGGGTFNAFSGFVIPANLATGDFIYIGGYGNITIAGEATKTYAGARRTVLYATFSQAHGRYYWDKQTGVMVEASVSSGGITVTAKATETNMWVFAPFWMQWWFWVIIAAGIVVLAGAIYLKRRKSSITPLLPPEGTDTIRVTGG